MEKNIKKSVMGPVISVFIMVLIISIFVGLTFLFVYNLKTTTTEIATTSDVRSSTISVVNETVQPTTAGTALTANSYRDCEATVSVVTNRTGATAIKINSGNYTVTGCLIANVTDTFNTATWNVTYTYTYLPITSAESSINTTEQSGITLISYLPLIFLAVIFGALLTLVLKIILPYINFGNSMTKESI